MKTNSNNILDKILPIYGNERVKTPIWNESQKMFITDQYVSAAGNTYYLGVRMSDRLVTVLHIGLYHSWTYINDVDLYVFDGQELKLVGRSTIDKYYDEELIQSTVKVLIKNYIDGQCMISGCVMDRQQLDGLLDEVVGASYHSMYDKTNVLQNWQVLAPILKEKQKLLS